MRRARWAIAALGLAFGACSSDNGDGEGDGTYAGQCTVDGHTGTCAPLEDPSACLGETLLCRCAVFMGQDGTESRYLLLDCNESCRADGYREGICVETTSSGAPSNMNHTCGCRD